jgi:single-strand DNA-binding protein
VNTVNVIGNLATDVELREVGEGGRKVARFLLAVDRGGRDGGADFFGVSVWERQAELCAEFLVKGDRVGLEGYLRSRTWEAEGKRRRVVEIVGRRVDFLSGPRSGDAPRDHDGLAEVIPFEPAGTA